MLPLLSALSAPSLVTALAMAVACATLSVFVVARRWAFIGEGISHSGFGGAGTAWALAVAFPATFDRHWMPYLGVVLFALLTALAIGYLTRDGRVSGDTAIGIFMVASLAWGIVGQGIYRRARGVDPVGWATYLFGDTQASSPAFAATAVAMGLAVVATVALLSKEILFYCFDPAMAEASGVRAGFVHYLMMLLVTLTILIGARVVGTVLVTALLVLPGATALSVTSRLSSSVAGSIAVGVLGTVGGLLINARWPFLPTGPAVVLSLFATFVLVYAWSRLRPTAA